MNRFLIILLALLSSTNSMSQNQPFDSAVRRLYFDVDIFNASGSVVDSFIQLDFLKYDDTVILQRDLHGSMFMDTKEDAWSSRHVFSFTKSPLAGLKIQSGQIIVTLRETAKIKKFRSVTWQVNFANKAEGELFYNKLKEIFTPLSTKQNTEYYKPVGHIAQYSTRKETEKGIRDVSFSFGISSRTNKYQILLTLFNEFAAE